MAVNWKKKKKRNKKDTTFLKTNEIFIFVTRCVRVQSFQSCLTLCDPMDSNPTGSSVRGIIQARILEWVAMPSFRGSSQPKDQTHISCSSCISGGCFTTEPPAKPVILELKHYFSLNTNCLPTKSFTAMTSFINKIKYSSQHHHPKSRLFARRAVKE